MATPSDSPIEEVVYEIEPSRVPKPVPVALEDLCRLTKFTRQEIRIMYRGFKTFGEGLSTHNEICRWVHCNMRRVTLVESQEIRREKAQRPAELDASDLNAMALAKRTISRIYD
ncbi:hypothetical protein QE152_g26730 [Popillia japonica]|uniref:Uncharacterized protein n=1 Tax=Popillia japonica TaxID=7064 RepID=A0AAW1JW12_POPJA